MEFTSISAVAANVSQAQSTASLLSQNAIFSATAGGRTYPADVTGSAGDYVATIPQLPGVSSSGGSLLTAESNLDLRISVLV